MGSTTVGLALVFFLCIGVDTGSNSVLSSISITRHHKGDIFLAQGTKCYEDLCLGVSSGTASPTDGTGCNCQCMPNLPIFRDDLRICVDDIQECTLAPFLSGTTTQKVPYVFLPLKGQIVYPSAEIIVSDVPRPICVVSGAQFLGRRGWIHLRNNSDTDLPFRLFRDEGRTYLQWLGEGDLRLAMEGRLILVHLLCKDASGDGAHKIFTPCIAFRVAGNPSTGVREMMFATDKNGSRDGEKSLSVSEYIAIGVCILLLGLIYVASLFLYFYFRRKKKQKKSGDGTHLTVAEEGIVKSNPLLQATRRHLAAVAGHENGGYATDSGSNCSESDRCSDIVLPEDEIGNNNHQNMEISATVHPCGLECNVAETLLNQDSNNIERLPEEDVSIVETLEGKEDRPETVRTMGSGNVRKKLYFNPAYFELDMLKAPPPAAIEFLTKIREVIAVAKHKMSAKRFSPSLIGIPEEEYYSRGGKPNSAGNRSRPASVLSFAGSTDSKKKKKSTCRTCVENEVSEEFKIPKNGSYCPNDTKQRIIRKWLEDVPFSKSETKGSSCKNDANKRNDVKTEDTSATEEAKKPPAPPQRKEVKKSTKGPAPPRPPPPPPVVPCIDIIKTPVKHNPEVVKPPSAPTAEIIDLQEGEDNIPRIQGKDKVPPVVAKTLMDAVIQEMIVQRKGDKNISHAVGVHNFIKKTLKSNFDMVNLKNARNEKFHNADKNIFEMDSLERKPEEDDKKPEKIDVNEEVVKEIDSCIEIYNEKKETIDSIIEPNEKTQDDHDYEVILLNPAEPEQEIEEKEKELKIYNLPEIMSKNDRSEGYSLVSEVYVNDGYSYSSDESTQSNNSNSNKNRVVVEKPGRLTIHVKDSPENYKRLPDETETFEPDTLDRKPGKFRYTKTIGNWEDNVQDQYSNQRFHEMDLECQHNNSLERPRISLKTSGSFRRNSLEKDVDDLFKNLNAPLARHFGSLREIYEAKSRGHRRRTETTSLVGSVSSDVECNSTLSWSEDRRNKLLHRGIILHVAGETKKHRRHKPKSYNYPDVVPPRPPKPSSLTATPLQRSGVSTPARSCCVSPNSRSACASPPPRSNCTSPRPVTLQFPPPPPRMDSGKTCISPSHSGRNSPVFPCLSPSFLSGRSSPTKAPMPPPRSLCSSPTSQKGRTSPSPYIPPPPKVTGTKPTYQSPCRSMCASPSPSRSPCASPLPPPRPPPKTTDVSPPLPPRCTKPPLPPKNSKSTRQRKFGGESQGRHSLARRPLPPIPSPRNYQDSTISSVSSRDLETLSMLSGASIDSLNSSDYEAFYTLPYDGHDGEIFDKATQRTHKIFGSFSPNPEGTSETGSINHKICGSKSRRKSLQRNGHKLEDSGYLSTHSESERRHRSAAAAAAMTSENTGSETEESLCDGASESGAESTATDSFFFGNFNRVKTAGSLDSGVGSEVNKNFLHTFRMIEDETIPETEPRDVLITVRQ
ncbi:UNVERIFIED_CONTAM: hypothetical protein PYX00_000061 [Menopon gallinae]|uniref:Shavenoid isoform B-like N-terminal domain-containing protein n=1 Tax=Menopon gallinae TaxID=328185 RepID=A0AAW2I8I3_9NEOP